MPSGPRIASGHAQIAEQARENVDRRARRWAADEATIARAEAALAADRDAANLKVPGTFIFADHATHAPRPVQPAHTGLPNVHELQRGHDHEHVHHALDQRAHAQHAHQRLRPPIQPGQLKGARHLEVRGGF